MSKMSLVASFGIGLALLASTDAMAQQTVLGESSLTATSNTTEETTADETRDFLLRVKAGIEGAMSTSTTNLASFWTLVAGVEIPVIWRETSIYAELGFGFWRPDSGLDHRTTPLAGSAGFFGAYYPVDWFGLRAGLKGYLAQGRYYEDGMWAQLNVEGDLLFNFSSGLELLLGVSGSVMGTGYHNADIRETLGPAVYPNLSLRYSGEIWDSPPPD
jgi:hypothetical protein